MKNNLFKMLFVFLLFFAFRDCRSQSDYDWVWYSESEIEQGVKLVNYFDNNSIVKDSKKNTVYFLTKSDYSKPLFDKHYNKYITCTMVETMLYCDEQKMADYKIKIIFSDNTFKEVDVSKSLFKYPIKEGTDSGAIFNTLCK